MAIPPGVTRFFVTREPGSVQALRAFFARAYPEVPAQRYVVLPVSEYVRDEGAVNGKGEVWAAFTAARQLEGNIHSTRLRVFHPVLSPEFIDELRYLTLFGGASAFASSAE
jgi:hypothetical protein